MGVVLDLAAEQQEVQSAEQAQRRVPALFVEQLRDENRLLAEPLTQERGERRARRAVLRLAAEELALPVRDRETQASSAAFACWAIAPNACGSLTASSASTLRSSVISALRSPAISWL